MMIHPRAAREEPRSGRCVEFPSPTGNQGRRNIVLNPHAANCCVLRLDEQAATALLGILTEWLG